MTERYFPDLARIQLKIPRLLTAIEKGDLSVHIGAEYLLAEAAAAHRALESRQTTGKVLLIP